MIVWKLNTPNRKVASVRYRALLPILALDELDYESRLVSGDANVDFNLVKTIIFVKSFSLSDLRLARDAHACGVPVIIDLCDNIFIHGYGKTERGPLPSDVFREMAKLAEAVVTTGEALKQIVEAECGEISVIVIPDGVETDLDSGAAANKVRFSVLNKAVEVILRLASQPKYLPRILVRYCLRVTRRLWARIQGRIIKKVFRKKYLKERLWRLRPYNLLKLAYKAFSWGRSKIVGLQANKKVSGLVPLPTSGGKPKRLLWFGNHGAPHAQFGILDILLIEDALIKLSTDINFELVVISNNKQKYDDNIAPLAFNSRYQAWDANTIKDEIRRSDVVLVPNSMDAFSLCKSANRSVLALQLGVPVVATKTRAMEGLFECVLQEDWQQSILSYLQSPSLVKEHLDKAQKVIRENYSAPVIGGRWHALLHDVTVPKTDLADSIPVRRHKSVAFCIGSKLDLDLLVPLITAAERKLGIHCQLVLAQAVLAESKEARQLIWSFKGEYSILSLANASALSARLGQTVGAVISGVETNLNPHRLLHDFVGKLNDHNVNTYTMQHGLDNVGLTYSDKVQPIGKVKFASNVIFTWLPLADLHSSVRADVREKCIHVGCTKLAPEERELTSETQKIAVFENIHWHRYSDQYRVDFLADLNSVAKRFPAVEFIVKPHPSGLWLTGRYTGELPDAANITILNPEFVTNEWAQSCSSLLQHVDAVITTPSTVALDAASAGLPVAVVSKNLDVVAYQPLNLLPDAMDWSKFIEGIGNSEIRLKMLNSSSVFSERYRAVGDAVDNILTRVCFDLDQQLL